MVGPPDPTLTVVSILKENWTAANVADTTPKFTIPYREKRYPCKDYDVIFVYTVTGQTPKRGLSNAFRDRLDHVSVDVSSAVADNGPGRMALLMKEVERIFDLAAVRSSPPTRPNATIYGSAGSSPDTEFYFDLYDCTGYDQLIPVGWVPHEDSNRQWWRKVYDLELRTYWEGRV